MNHMHVGNQDQLLSFEEIDKFEYLICLDSEWTCWENSLENRWSDPEYPPEAIQIGLAIYDLSQGRILDEFVSYVSPTINPILSDYCKNLLLITQEIVDQARRFPEVSNDISVLLKNYSPSRGFICSFGSDWEKIAANALRCTVNDPLVSFQKLDLYLELSGILEHDNDSKSREVAWEILGLPEMPNRHDALVDAHDVKRILDAAREYCKDFISELADHQPLRK